MFHIKIELFISILIFVTANPGLDLMNNYMLHFKSFSKWYGDYSALSVDDISLASGIYWVKGMNGSGKSTLLKSLAGILDFKGDILLGDISIKKNAVQYRKLVNFAEAEPLFPEFLTGTELIRLFAKAKAAPAGQENEYIQSMGMTTYTGRPIGSYSSGMLKKLSLVLAFLGNPKLILLDEPLITIDTASLDILYRWIRVRHLNGTSFLLSSHQALNYENLPVTGGLLIENQALSLID